MLYQTVQIRTFYQLVKDSDLLFFKGTQSKKYDYQVIGVLAPPTTVYQQNIDFNRDIEYTLMGVFNVDGYIKNKTEAIISVKKTILLKYLITFFILILVPVWLFAIAVNQHPDKWTQTDIVFSHISQERIGLQRGQSYVLNTQDGRQFVIKSKFVNVDDLSDCLISGDTYRIVFSNTIAGGDHMEALSGNNIVFQNLEKSVAQWEQEQQECVIAIIVTLIIEIVALLLIDRLWCKKEHSQIQKLKADIARRKEHIREK